MAKHTHQYRRAILGKDYEIYKCTLPGCTHYISAELILGKKNKCWRCGDEHYITRRLAKPHCAKCTKGKGEIPEELHQHIEEQVSENVNPSSALDILLGRVRDV